MEQVDDLYQFIESRRNQQRGFEAWTQHKENEFLQSFIKLKSELDKLKELLRIQGNESVYDKVLALIPKEEVKQ